MRAQEFINEACWKGYKQIGMKKKGGKTVPNCVPKNETTNYHFAGAAVGQKTGLAGQLRGNAKPRKDGKQPAFNKLVGGGA
jgi:hypothetical protein